MKHWIPSMVIVGAILLVPPIVYAQEQKEIPSMKIQIQRERSVCEEKNEKWHKDFYLSFPIQWQRVPMKEVPPHEKRLPQKEIIFPKNKWTRSVFA